MLYRRAPGDRSADGAPSAPSSGSAPTRVLRRSSTRAPRRSKVLDGDVALAGSGSVASSGSTANFGGPRGLIAGHRNPARARNALRRRLDCWRAESRANREVRSRPLYLWLRAGCVRAAWGQPWQKPVPIARRRCLRAADASHHQSGYMQRHKRCFTRSSYEKIPCLLHFGPWYGQFCASAARDTADYKRASRCAPSESRGVVPAPRRGERHAPLLLSPLAGERL